MKMVTAIIPTCRNCGSTFIIRDEDGPYCGMCRRTYSLRKQVGRLGGLQTLKRYGRQYMREIARKGGYSSGR